MTRSKLRSTLSRIYWFLGLILIFSLLAKFSEHIPGLKGTPLQAILKDGYEFVRDMALLIATGGVAYVTNVFQHRSSFVSALREEWRLIVESKSSLFSFTQLERPTLEQYLTVYCQLSETIDNMRTVYANVGESDDAIGLYPYAPLHDMRRAFQTLDPRDGGPYAHEQRKLVRDAVLQSFYAVRDGFLEELDLDEPESPVLIHGARRLKKPGTTAAAQSRQDRERERQDRHPAPSPEIAEFLKALYDKEHSTRKAWRDVPGGPQPNAQVAPAPAPAPAS